VTSVDLLVRRLRLIGLCTILAVLCIFAFVLDSLLLRTMTNRMHMNDFGKFYYSARAFLDGGDMYGPSPATRLPFEGSPQLEFLNMNPPHFHLLVMPFALLAPDTAVTLWIVVSILALFASLVLIGREIGVNWTPVVMLAVALGVLAFSGTQAFFLTGQLSMLLMLATTLCWIEARHGRWVAAAIWMGIGISVKPFELIFVPYLLLTRRIRAAWVALMTTAACFAVGLLVFGVDNYQEWVRALGESSQWVWAEMNASILGLFSRMFEVQPIVATVSVRPDLVKLWIVAAGLVGVTTLAIVAVDAGTATVDRAFALLLVAAVLMSPLGWIYYMTIPAGPIAAIVLASAQRRSHRWWMNAAGGVAVVGLFWPHPLLGAFQPSPWATLFFTSAYTWATLAAWAWLVLETFEWRAEGFRRSLTEPVG
jgi:alpha-1,2-mannosyltransferase